MALDAYVKMVTCECGYFQGDETFYVHAASSLQEFSEKNMKYYSVHPHLKNNDNNYNNNNKKLVHQGTRIEAAWNCVFDWTVCILISVVCIVFSRNSDQIFNK